MKFSCSSGQKCKTQGLLIKPESIRPRIYPSIPIVQFWKSAPLGACFLWAGQSLWCFSWCWDGQLAPLSGELKGLGSSPSFHSAFLPFCLFYSRRLWVSSSCWPLNSTPLVRDEWPSSAHNQDAARRVSCSRWRWYSHMIWCWFVSQYCGSRLKCNYKLMLFHLAIKCTNFP